MITSRASQGGTFVVAEMLLGAGPICEAAMGEAGLEPARSSRSKGF